MSVTAPILRPQAEVMRVYDGDTYLMLLDLRGRGFEQPGCETAWIRLRNFSARELGDVATVDPKGLGRVDGPTAKQLAQQTLAAAKQITVELVGPAGPAGQSFDRHVATVFVDGQSLGDVLTGLHAVAPGKFMGVPATGPHAPGFAAGGIVPERPTAR